MILNSKCFCSWQEFVKLCDIIKTLIVFEYFTKDFCLWKMYIEDKIYLFHQCHKRYYLAHRLAQ